MKSIIRWGATLGLAGSIMAGMLIGTVSRVLALTDEQVAEQLRPVPVFAITDENGAPLFATPQEGQQGSPVTGVFISRQDAETFLQGLNSSNPDLANRVQIRPVSLAEVYQLARNVREQDENVAFDIVPMQQEVNSALEVLRQGGRTVEEFNGVPLFAARASSEDGGYLTVQRGEQQVIPMFFKREELDTLLNRLRESQPDLANTMVIQVISLEDLIATFQSSDNPELRQIVLVPPRETIDYVRSQQGQGSQPTLQPQR